jgi:putative phage-type endonuclease
MKKLTATGNLPHEEWLKWRKLGIGGSDAGAVCGLNPYRTAMEVYLDKTKGSLTVSDNEAMRQGREFEDYVARRFMEATGKKVRRANFMYCDERNPFMLADVDRLVVGENAGLECKTASPYLADRWENGKIPLHYQIQCHHYMSVCNADAWYIAVLIYGKEFKWQRMERDETVLSDLVRIEKEFWEEHVKKKKVPDPDGSRLADCVLAEYFRVSAGACIPLSGFDGKLERRQALSEDIEKLETEKRRIEQELKLYLGEAELAENERYRVSWKTVSSSRLDEKRLKEERPEVYEQYKKTIQNRRFTVKAA